MISTLLRPSKNEAPAPAECRERLWDVIFRSPSVFGRLTAVSELHSPATGRYEHAHAAEYGVEAVDHALRRMHREVFTEWLCFGLEQQEKDLRVWLSWLDGGREESSRLLRRMKGRLNSLLPRERVLEHERLLF